jgi:predicted component of type VI protein secretion system
LKDDAHLCARGLPFARLLRLTLGKAQLERQLEAKLVVVAGDSSASQYELQLPAVIGRSRSTDLRLGHPLVSRQHCEVFESRGVLMVRDLGSLNGTYVGERRIAEKATPVKPGELLTVGPVTFRAEYQAVEQRPARPSTWDSQQQTVDDPLPPAGEGGAKPSPRGFGGLDIRDSDSNGHSKPTE